MPLDIGIGILLAILTSHLYTVELTGSLVVAGILFSLLPDIDAVIELIMYKKLGGKEIRIHREGTHYPLLYLPLTAIVWLLAGNEYAFLFGTAILLHFLHDSIGIGWGIKWLAPFSKNNYKFFSNKVGARSGKLVVSWKPEELQRLVKERGNEHWIRDIYLRPSAVLIIELFGLLIAMGILFLME